ncbi:MAG: TonB-dependent siderophore receptor [Gammaproteobacteria bacterium]
MDAIRNTGLGLMLWLGAAIAIAQDARMDFNIPPQPLPGALNQLGRQAELQMLYDGPTAEGKTSSGLVGSYTRYEALEKLLAGTGLTYTITGDNTVAVTVADNQPSSPQQSTKKSKDTPTELEEMVVTASPRDETSYTVPNASTATKTDTPIFDTPVSIQVVPYSVIQDQKGYRLEDAVKNVSGVRANIVSGYADIFRIRGFGSPVLRNGLGSLDNTSVDTVTAERIEVLKGPASILYGRIEPGGLINLVTKKPLEAAYYSAEQQFGSYDFYRTQWDATGPVNQDASFLYRFTGAYQNSGSFRDFHDLERVVVYPSLTWRPTNATEATLSRSGVYSR